MDSVNEIDAAELSGEFDGHDEERHTLHDIPKTQIIRLVLYRGDI